MFNPDDVFVSYASGEAKSRKMVKALSKALETKGLSVWLPEKTVHVGASWEEEMEKALENSQTFVFLLTPSALKSQFTNFEIGVAASRAARSPEVRIVPVLLGGAKFESMPGLFRNIQGIDANGMSDKEAANAVAEALALTGKSA